MTGANMTERGEGEVMEARRRRLFWITIGTIVSVGAVIGFVAGATAAITDLAIDEIWRELPPSLVIGLAVFTLVGFSYGTWRFAMAADEVEIADNLWGSTASYYVYAVMFPIWWALGKANILPEPHDWAIYFAALAGGGVIYLWRKWSAR